MALKDQSQLRLVLYEGRDSEPLQAETRFALVSALLERGHPVTRATGDAVPAPRDGSPLMVLGRFPAGTKPPGRVGEDGSRVWFEEVSEAGAEAVIERVEAVRAEAGALRPGDWKPWFPVIDYDRCTNCMQCLSFCLFGVYGVDAGQRIEAQNPDSCKTNCPACSRVCPEAAILFPKYKSGPINGDVVSAADLQREKMKIDISALLGGDIYSMLRDRNERAKSRFSKERDSGKALNERLKCLQQLQESVEIPPEVLMNLPSPDEIQRRAQEAMARAQTALQNQPVEPAPRLPQSS